MEVVTVYPAPALVEIGDRHDNDPPEFEEVKLYKVSDALITSFGYVVHDFSFLKESISFRHRNNISAKNLVSFCFLKKKIVIREPAISIANGWYGGYYHFTLECLPKLFILRNFIESSKLIFPKKIQKFHREWFELLGIKNVLFLEENEVAKVPLALTSSFPARDLNHHHLILPGFSAWVLSHIKIKNSLAFKKVFIGRKYAEKRKILNLEAVKSYLQEKGFVHVEMEDYSVEDQIKLFHNAEQIVCAHGAALSNLCFCKPQTKVVDLLFKDFKQWCFLKLSIIQDIDYQIFECEGNKAHTLPDYCDIEVDIIKLNDRIIAWE